MDSSVINTVEERLLQLSEYMLTFPLNTLNTTKLDFFKLLEGFLVLYDECRKNDRRTEEHLNVFSRSYNTIVSEIRSLQVNASDFQDIGTIGSGRFGTVSVVKEIGTDRYYALKVMKKYDILRQLEVVRFREERDIMAMSSSPWLTSLHYAFQDTENLYLVMEFYQGGCLSNLIEYFDGRLAEQMARFYLAELLLALRSLHDMGYVHRDVKPDNILIDSGGHLKLADFGSAARLNSDGHVTDCVSVGTSEYIAPEVLNAVEDVGSTFRENCYGAECDFWSYGIVAFELVTGFTPFVGENDMQTHRNILCHEKCFSFPKDVHLSAELMDLISKLLTTAAQRISCQALLEHAFFSEIDWETQIHSHPPYIPTVDSFTDTSNFNKSKANKLALSVNGLKKPRPFSDVPFVGFMFCKAVSATNVKQLIEHVLYCKISDLQDHVNGLDAASRSVEKWHIKCVLDKRELVRRLKHAQELCAISEKVSTSFVKNARATWEKQYKDEKDQMAAKIEELEQELKNHSKESLKISSSNDLELKLNPSTKTGEGCAGHFNENVECDKCDEEKENHFKAVVSELGVVKAELMRVNLEKEANTSELSDLRETVEKLKSSLNLEKEKTECMMQELELYRSRGLIFTTGEYEKLVNAVLKLQREFENVLRDQVSVKGKHVELRRHSETNISRENIVEALGEVAGKALIIKEALVDKRRNISSTGINTECAICLHKESQTDMRPVVDPLLLKVQSEFECLKQEHERGLAELRSISAYFEAELKRLADASRDHVKDVEVLREVNCSETRKSMAACKEWVRAELCALQEQLRAEKARASSCTDQLESFKKMFLDKNAEAHNLRKQLECLERELRDELARCTGQDACDRDSLVRSLSQALRQLQEERRNLQAANAALVKASADLEDQVDQYHSMVTHLQSQLLLLRADVPLRNS